MNINLAKDFSPNPFGRYLSDGPNSGERFRELLRAKLNKCKDEGDVLHVYIDDVNIGIGSSFLDESFAGLVFKGFFTPGELEKLLKIETNDESYKDEIWSYINEAEGHRL
ncbi:STAS-like domain-containing protein [Shewanella sp.]|uniref:STAS-like domain-containing protein n=1 Tax=Shewanella sp. TaxID=50422 RepID=UPI003562635B